MQQTSNYGLSQRELTDRIRMEDFNRDNSKIDEELKANADAITAEAAAREAADTALANRSRFTKLKEFTSTEASSFLEIFLNDIDWSKWDKVHLDTKPTTNGSYYFYTTTSTEQIGSVGCSRYDNSWAPRITFNVGFRPDRTLDISCAGSRGPSGATYSQLVKMAFSGTTMQPGAQFVLWGEA